MLESQTQEGEVTRKVEEQTARTPSILFLSGAIGSIAVSLGLMLSGRKEAAQFVGQWVPTILLLGIYNKIVKVAGSERAAPLQSPVH